MTVPESKYHMVGEEKGYIYQGGYTGRVDDNRVLWECIKCGLVFHAEYRNIQHDKGCPKCAIEKHRISEKQYRARAKKLDVEYLRGYTGYIKDKVWWRCPKCKLEWKEKYYDTNRAGGCPHCKRENPGLKRITEEQYHRLGNERGCPYIGGYTGSTKDRVQWTCPDCNNVWQASYNQIQKSKRGCCLPCSYKRKADKLRLPELDYHKLAASRGIAYLGGYTGKTSDPVCWECPECRNRWETSYAVIYNGGCCPVCSSLVNGVKASKPQLQIADMLDGEANYPVGSRYVDVALVDKKVAIEYDCWFWHGDKTEEDRERAQEIINEGWSVLAIKTNAKIPTKQQILDAIEQLEGYSEIILDDWGKGKVGSSVFKI